MEKSEPLLPSMHQFVSSVHDKDLCKHEDQDTDILSPSTLKGNLKGKVLDQPGPWSLSVLQQTKVLREDGSIVDSSLRRSERQKGLNKGFKASSCRMKGCLGCLMDPPTLSPTVIRNLGSSFCSIDPALLTEDALGKKIIKKKKSAPSPSGNKQQKKNRPSVD